MARSVLIDMLVPASVYVADGIFFTFAASPHYANIASSTNLDRHANADDRVVPLLGYGFWSKSDGSAFWSSSEVIARGLASSNKNMP